MTCIPLERHPHGVKIDKLIGRARAAKLAADPAANPSTVTWVQGTISWLWTQMGNQQIQFELNTPAPPLFELNPGPGYQDASDLVKGVYFSQGQIIVVYDTTPSGDGTLPVYQVALAA